MSETNLPSGVLCINKPSGVTSHDVVNRIRRLYGTKKVGHTGTLDPIASGVLVVLVGRAVKASEYLLSESKEYIAGIKLGITTDTLDTSGRILSFANEGIPCEDELSAVLHEFTGRILQTPPMYSALKVGGKKLYELARNGVEIDRKPREIEIYSIDYLGKTSNVNEYLIKIACSKGTYIRVLCDDIGKRLGCGAAMSSLIRTKNGPFTIDNSLTTDEIDALDTSKRASKLLPVEAVFSELKSVGLPPFFAKLARCGNEIYTEKIGALPDLGERVRLYDGDTFFALGEVMDFPDGRAIKPLKQFDI